jgi:non-ribosomal peptide synthetase component F
MKTQLTYWREQLSDISSTPSFGKMFRETSGTSFRTSRIAFELNENLTSGLKALARTQHCTPFMVLIAGFSVVLFNFTNEPDIRIATLVANRRRKSTELTLGHFVNTVVLRIGIRPDSSFGELLTHVREVTMTAYTHQELPFEQVARELAEDNDKRLLLFRVLCMYQSSSSESIQTPGLTFAPLNFRQLGIDPDITITGADLVLDVRESSSKLIGSLIYKINVIDLTTATRIAEHFTDVLECLLSSPESEIAKFNSGG